MKKIIAGLLFAAALCGLYAAPKNKALRENADGSISITAIDKDASVKTKQKADGFTDVTVVTGSKITKNNPVTVDLSAFANKEILISMSMDIKIADTQNDDNEIIWMINDVAAGMPVLYRNRIKTGEWTNIKGEIPVPLGTNKQLYISGAGLNKENIVFYFKNIDIKISGEGIGASESASVKFADAPSLKSAYEGKLDHIGIAVGYNGELNNTDIQEMLSKQVNSITMGNETKPDFLFNWAKPSNMEKFLAEDGKEYDVPMGMPSYGNLKQILFTAQEMQIKMRGHVLVWHNQTPEWFFKVNYSSDKDAAFVDAATMNARLEWYIKKVFDEIAAFEKRYNNGEHIFYAWDVVNEAVADGAGSQKWLREDSNWYRVYKDETFIINAFRYANKYAPAEVELVYNDYNCYSAGKRDAICRLVDKIKATPDARIDAVGMQSHVKIDYPAVKGNNSYETAVKAFISHGVDVQVTELDIANGSKSYSPVMLKAKYKEYFKLFLENRKTEGEHGISGVTIWGLTDKGTWLNSQAEYKGHDQYPVLLNGDYTVKPAFYGVLEAAEN